MNSIITFDHLESAVACMPCPNIEFAMDDCARNLATLSRYCNIMNFKWSAGMRLNNGAILVRMETKIDTSKLLKELGL